MYQFIWHIFFFFSISIFGCSCIVFPHYIFFNPRSMYSSLSLSLSLSLSHSLRNPPPQKTTKKQSFPFTHTLSPLTLLSLVHPIRHLFFSQLINKRNWIYPDNYTSRSTSLCSVPLIFRAMNRFDPLILSLFFLSLSSLLS